MKQIIKVHTIAVLLIISIVISVSCTNTGNKSKQNSEHSFKKHSNVEWAKPKGVSLTMDIYVPETVKASYPVLIIYHGGAWLINDNSIMNSLSEYIATHSEYVVCNVNYRLLIDNSNTTLMNEIIEDALGAVLWVKENIVSYKGDPTNIAVTGDSAGGHLASSVVVFGKKISSNGFVDGEFNFVPTYLPKGTSADDIANEGGINVQAAVLSYGAFNLYETALGGFEDSINFWWGMANCEHRGFFGNDINIYDNPNYYKAVSPLFNVPDKNIIKLPPQFCLVGSKDDLTTPAKVEKYVNALTEAGQDVKYWIYEGQPHAFLDSGTNQYLGTDFSRDAPAAIDRIIAFLDGVFY